MKTIFTTLLFYKALQFAQRPKYGIILIILILIMLIFIFSILLDKKKMIVILQIRSGQLCPQIGKCALHFKLPRFKNKS